MRLSFLAVLVPTILTVTAGAQPTAFTYQGRLKNGAQPAAGPHDFRFTLFNVASGGVQLAPPVCADNVAVTDGLFTATIDFGQQFVSAEPRFLQIEVRSDTGATCADPAGLILLGPRQPLTAAPIATHASTAFALAAADGSPANVVSVDNDGKVGIGTSSPAAPLHLRAAGPFAVLQDTASAANQAGYIGFWNNAGAETGWLGFGSPGSPQLSIVNARPSGDVALSSGTGGTIRLATNATALTVTPTGNVGIGTTAPTTKLDVRGNIKLGSTGQFSAVGGQEDLRLVRGYIDGDGSVLNGTGFSVSRVGEGHYLITFVPAFAGTPSVTATAVWPTADNTRHCVIQNTFLVPGSVPILINSGGGTSHVDSKFCFIAVGPR